MRWDRLSILIDRLAHEQEEMGVMLTMGDGKVVSIYIFIFTYFSFK